MPLIKNQDQMEAYVKSEMLEFLSGEPSNIYSMMHPRLVRCDYSARTLEMVMQTSAWMRNISNTLHGGITAALLDTVGGMACRCFAPVGADTPTVSLQVSYLDAVTIGTQVQVRAIVTHPGRSIVHVRMEAFPPEEPERLCATGVASYFIKKDTHAKTCGVGRSVAR